MVGEVNWPTFWAAVAAIAAVIIIPVSLAIGGWQLQQGRKTRQAANDAAARQQETTLREEETALASVTWRFKADLWVPIRNAVPLRPPIELGIIGANVWIIHEVRLSWAPQDSPGPWITEDASCEPWNPADTFPLQLHAGGQTLAFGWPPPNPSTQEGLRHEMRALYSVTRDGSRHWRRVIQGNLGWQVPE